MFRSGNDGQIRTIILSLLTPESTPFFLNPLYIYRVLQSLNCYFNARSLANQPTHFSTILSWNLVCGWLFLKSSDICSSPRPSRPKCSLPRLPRPKCRYLGHLDPNARHLGHLGPNACHLGLWLKLVVLW